MLIRMFGVEVEVSLRAFYVSASGLGEMWVETRSVVRGRKWADYAAEDGNLTVHLGRTFIVFSPPRSATMLATA